MLDPLWLLVLLPAAMAGGWWAARRSNGNGKNIKLPEAYFQGLNFLLNEQPDKAIEVFLKVLEVDSETVEMHLTLGNLFRRRGEIERATRIHQNLIARPNLQQSLRLQALYELAQDYLRAGLLDRAESLLLELSDVSDHKEAALRYLKDIYEQEKEWEKAIGVLKRLESFLDIDASETISQYLCELADDDLSRGDTEAAMDRVAQALKTNRSCARAIIQKGSIEYQLGEFDQARKSWVDISDEDVWCLIPILDRVIDCFGRLNERDGLDDLLNRILERTTHPNVLMTKVNELERSLGTESAIQFLEVWLAKQPSIAGLARLLELERRENGNGSAQSPVKVLLNDLMGSEGTYRCSHCGFTGRTLYWHCPGCRSWESQEPLTGPQLLSHSN